MSEQIFFQLAVILVIAFLVSYVARLLKQPLIIGYILAGIIVSPFLIMFGANTEVIGVFSKIGIAFLAGAEFKNNIANPTTAIR